MNNNYLTSKDISNIIDRIAIEKNIDRDYLKNIFNKKDKYSTNIDNFLNKQIWFSNLSNDKKQKIENDIKNGIKTKDTKKYLEVKNDINETAKTAKELYDSII